MTDILLDKDTLVENIRRQFKTMAQLKYKRSLLEFENDDGSFLGDNVFETSFKTQGDVPPLIYEVSGPYDVLSNEYATIGRIYHQGKRIFEADIKDQIQQRTAAMVWLSFAAIGHIPDKILMVGAGRLAIETVRYLKHFMPELDNFDYHARNARPDSFESVCRNLGIKTHYKDRLSLDGYDTIIMVTNTTAHLIDGLNFDSLREGAVVASLCTTSQTGELAGEIYARDDVRLILDYDLSRRFTPDMRAADDAGYLNNVTYLQDIIDGGANKPGGSQKTLLRLTGTPMQNIAVIDMLQE